MMSSRYRDAPSTSMHAMAESKIIAEETRRTKHHQHHHHHHSTEVPSLMKSLSGSSSSSPTTPEFDKPSKTWKRRQHHQQHHHHHHHESGSNVGSAASDDSIRRGAEILRRQLLITKLAEEHQPSGVNACLPVFETPSNLWSPRRDTFCHSVYDIDPHADDDQFLMAASHNNNNNNNDAWGYHDNKHQMRLGIGPLTSDKTKPKNNNSLGKPYIMPHQKGTSTLPRHRATSPPQATTEEDSEWSFMPPSVSASTESAIDTTFDIVDNTSSMLPSKSRYIPDASPPKEAPPPSLTDNKQLMVERVVEMDNSTFVSAASEKGYLPVSLKVKTSNPQQQRGSPNAQYPSTPPAPKQPEPTPRQQQQRRQRQQQLSSSDSYDPLEVLQDLQMEEVRGHSQNDERPTSEGSMERRRPPPPTKLISNLSVYDEFDDSIYDAVVSPLSRQYQKLAQNPGFLHAKRAGILWQSLVSQHVRFPAEWWNGFRSPPLGVGTHRSWTYYGRNRIHEDKYFNSVVAHRGSPGQILLHIVVQDDASLRPIQDMAIGCFHPNARGVRVTPGKNPSLEKSRDLWLGTRTREDGHVVIETFLREVSQQVNASPLGGKHAVNNNNMRAVFGEKPPIQTVFLRESEVYELFTENIGGGLPPVGLLLQNYFQG